MDRTNLSEAILHDCVAVFAEELQALAPVAVEGDLAAIEHCFQQAMRVVGGAFLTHVLRERAAALPRPEGCPRCGQGMRLIDAARARSLQTLVGDACMTRPLYVCTGCHQGHAPVDMAMGVGSLRLSPGLARVACRLGIEESFETVTDVLQETIGVHVLPEAVRRVSEAMGAVAEADQQERITRMTQGAVVETAEGVDTLVVEVDGVIAHLDDAWHEMKVGRAAPLGPDVQQDTRAGRVMLQLGASHCGAGLEEAERAWYRFYLLALDAGLGRATTRIVVLGDGAHWIWTRATEFLGGPTREIIEIVDIFHAYEHLWTVGRAVFADTASCWVEPLKDALYTHGAPAVIEALAQLGPLTPEAAETVRAERTYFTTHQARMAYPTFTAQHLPIGSGAIESLCKNLVQERAKGAGMRWSHDGIQNIITLRALHRSRGWDTFWSQHPLSAHRRRWPPARPLRLRPDPAPPVPDPVPDPLPSLPQVTLPRPHPWRGPMILPRSA